MGRGLAAILAVSERRGDSDELRELAVELIAPNPHQPRRALRRGRRCSRWRSRSRRTACCSRCSCARWPAGRSSSSPASAAGAPRGWRAWRRSPRSCASATTRRRSSSRWSRTWPARTSTRSRRRAPAPPWSRSSSLTREEVGRRVGRSRVAVSNLLRLLDLPDDALDAARGRRPDRGPWPRAPARRGPCRAPPPRSLRGRRGLVGARRSRPGPARRTASAVVAARRRAAPRAALHPDQEAARRGHRRDARRAPSARTSRCVPRARVQGRAGARRLRGSGALAGRIARGSGATLPPR